MHPGVWGFTETHMTRPALTKFHHELKFHDIKASISHGHFAPPVSQSPGTLGGKATGTAVLSHSPLRPLTQEWDEQLWSSGRLHAAATLIQQRWLKLGVAYGHAKNPHLPTTVAQTDAVLAQLTDRIVHQSYGFRAIVGDFNNSQGNLPQFDIWRREGWVELQEYALAKWGRPIQYTYKQVSTIDFVWISPELVPYLRDVQIDSSYFVDHSIVFGLFSFEGTIPSVPVWRKPLPMPWSQVPETFAPSIQVDTTHGSDQFMHNLFIEVESAVDDALRSGNHQGLLPQQKGRCATTAPVYKRHQVTPVRPGTTGTPEIKFHGEHFQYTQWVRQLRRLHSLCLGLAKSDPSPTHLVNMQRLWDSIRAAPGFPKGFPRAWQDRSVKLPGSPTHLPRTLPKCGVAEIIFASFEADFRGHWEAQPPRGHDVHFFVDGGCLHSKTPALRLGTWAVAFANLHCDSFEVFAQGFTPGRFQTAMRSEITAMDEAFRAGIQLKRNFSVWTDNQTVFDRINRWIRKGGPPLSSRARNADLWNSLRRHVLVALQLDLLQAVCKVRSHQDPQLYSDLVERWALRGNNFVDKMTADVQQSMPSRLRELLEKKQKELQKRDAMRKHLHSHMYLVGARAVACREHRQTPLPGACNTDTTEMLDHQSSVEPLPATLADIRLPPNVAQHGQQILDWLKQLQHGERRHNVWLSSYQLFAHYQFTTGNIGVMYDTKVRRYVQLLDSEAGPYSFVRGASWFTGLLKCTCLHMGLPYIVEYKAPAGVTILGWHRCLLIRVSDEVIRSIDTLFSSAGVRQVKKIASAFCGVSGFWPKA
eukprot:Skav200694  [mRNA]  locus=scaffold343:58478:63264:- [translate_table: standard]